MGLLRGVNLEYAQWRGVGLSCPIQQVESDCQSIWQLSKCHRSTGFGTLESLLWAWWQLFVAISFVGARVANSPCRSGAATTGHDEYLQNSFLIEGARLRLACARAIDCLFQQTGCIMEDNVVPKLRVYA